jgi:hypothetical protein
MMSTTTIRSRGAVFVMTDVVMPVPGHRDIARALSATLAAHREQLDEVLKVLGAQ